eukprot:GHVR01046596.1.p1 GENE.GHVR01046596.1~~GHVR01046596.1.p1  ORF type:complete len:236 (+),score=31.23 GHVR01046596.1:574-1281(+)
MSQRLPTYFKSDEAFKQLRMNNQPLVGGQLTPPYNSHSYMVNRVLLSRKRKQQHTQAQEIRHVPTEQDVKHALTQDEIYAIEASRKPTWESNRTAVMADDNRAEDHRCVPLRQAAERNYLILRESQRLLSDECDVYAHPKEGTEHSTLQKQSPITLCTKNKSQIEKSSGSYPKARALPVEHNELELAPSIKVRASVNDANISTGKDNLSMTTHRDRKRSRKQCFFPNNSLEASRV